jgi:hypothetical protein
MNLIDLITRKDKRLIQVGCELAITRVEWFDSWRAIRVLHSDTPQLVMINVFLHYAMRTYPSDIGWYVSVPGGSDSHLLEVVVECGTKKVSYIINVTSTPTPVFLRWPDPILFSGSEVRISFHFKIDPDNHANLLIHRRIERSQILRYAKGFGVELGPGPNPQVHPSDDITVEYVEEFPLEKWIESYDQKGKYGAKFSNFSNYKIGSAWNLPQSDNSLDFIFSSHVVEHLANPIGHFLQWKKKLKPNGLILGVVPDMTGTKDYVALPSSLDEFEEEFSKELIVPTLKHYARWADMKNWGNKVNALMEKKISIHAHFYTPESMTNLLEHCVNRYGFSNYSIIQSRNHKDFYFVLK